MLVFAAAAVLIVAAQKAEGVEAPPPKHPAYRPYYQFGYQVKDAHTDDFHGHMEFSKGDKTMGEFKVQLPDGRIQVVSYEADDYGYRPTISYEYPSRPVAKIKKKPHSPSSPKGHHLPPAVKKGDLYLVAVDDGRYVVLAKKKHK